MADRAGQRLILKSVDGERDRRPEDDRDVDPLVIHIEQTLPRIAHAGPAPHDVRRERPADARPEPFALAPDTAFDQDTWLAQIVRDASWRAARQLFGHPLRQPFLRLLAVAVGIND